MPLDPNVPPHKTKPFWYIVVLAAVMCVGYPLSMSSQGPLWSHVVVSVATIIIIVSLGWFAARRAQRGETRHINLRFFLFALVFAIIFFVLAALFKKHP